MDKDGQPYLRVTRRIDRKTGRKYFPQEHWENGRWVPGAPAPKIPYRLPQLIAARPTEPVFICEGEKDADNVAALGCVAGRAHASEVAGALKAFAKEIRIVSFLELPEHGDVSDWLAQGPTKDELLARAKAGRVPSKGYSLIKASDIQPRNVDWLWPGHLPGNRLEMLAGLPGAGKSQIQDHYVACVTTGVPWPDGANGQGRRNVIMLTAEDTLDDTLISRLIAAGADLDRANPEVDPQG